MIFEPITPFSPCEFRVKFAAARWEREGAYALRRSVFCDEQQLFAGDDRDGARRLRDHDRRSVDDGRRGGQGRRHRAHP